MYTTYFGLKGNPFSNAPDPRRLYLSERRRATLAELFQGLGNGGGVVLLTACAGTGKTVICRALQRALSDKVTVANLNATARDSREVLLAVCAAFGISAAAGDGSAQSVADSLYRELRRRAQRGENFVLIIDDAHELGAEALGTVQFLTRMKQRGRALLHIFLTGEPSLLERLHGTKWTQLVASISAQCTLAPLNGRETASYIRHQLNTAEVHESLFTRAAIRRIHALSGGRPRLINTLCDRALFMAYVAGRDRADRRTVNRVATSLTDAEPPPRRRVPSWLPQAAAVLLAVAGTWGLVNWWAEITHFQHHARQETHGGPLDAAAAGPAPARAAETPALPTPRRDTAHRGKHFAAVAPGRPLVRLADLAGSPAATRAVAAQRLLVNWKVPTADVSKPSEICDRATDSGLKCLQGEGTIADLRHLNRPALLNLRSRDGQAFYAVLVGLGQDSITLDIGGASYTYALADLQAYWHGEYLLLWRPPLPGVDVIGRSSSPQSIAWLRETLNQVLAQPALDPHGSEFDWPVVKAVMAFQAQAGVPVDGTVGAATFIALNTARAIQDVPLLAAR